MYDIFSSVKSLLPTQQQYKLPKPDFKIGFPFSSPSSSSSEQCSYSAIPESQDSAFDIPLLESPETRRRSLATLEELEATFSATPHHVSGRWASARRIICSSSMRLRLLAGACLVVLLAYTCCYTVFRPPNYIILPPEQYLETLNGTLYSCIAQPKTREALLRHLQRVPVHDNSRTEREADSSSIPTRPTSLVPEIIWSSDKKQPPGAWAAKWKELGFDPKFLDDAAAEAWVKSNWAGTPVKKMWDTMPRFILKVDLLRYLLILLEGGTWSDMDTLPLMPREDWAINTEPVSSVLPNGHPGINISSPEPVRMIIGIENDPNENYDPRNWFERWRFLPLNRHRPMQFVQWTLHGAPNHPILLDVLRRVLQATQVYQAHVIEWERVTQAEGWGWNDSEESSENAQAIARESRITSPWEHAKYTWKWQAGKWRWGWNTLSVEEWTGPAVFTDATFSYLYAAARIRPEDLTMLRQPVQIRDVVIVPSLGFNPRNNQVKGVSRLVHLFRGSWKG